ncbi:MAG: DUF3566 domain-containing protein [Pseudonocardia sp.]|nr:DUF3566 domain-containing protein [Pseudonocardia sp.]
MSSNDSTQPADEGRTVATDTDHAEQASPGAPSSGDAVSGGSTTDGVDGTDAHGAGSNGANTNGRVTPSPVPRTTDTGTAGDVPAPRAEDVAEPASAEPVPSAATTWGQDPPASEAPGSASARTQMITPGGQAEHSSGPAAGPPPWRRVPGDHPAEPEEAERPSVADSLLSEAPTAFLAAPSAAGAGAAAGSGTATRDREGTETVATEASSPRSSRHRPPRQALLQLKRLDPWSVLKMALALAVVLFLVWMVAAGVLYGVLGGMGVWDRLNGTYADLVTGQTQNSGALISAGRVFLLAGVVGAINSLLFAVALTIVAFVYNVAADLVGGIEVTLSERD